MATISRRENADGHISYQVKVRVLGHPTKSKTFTLERDAIKWGRETEIAIERGLFFDRSIGERTTINSLIERYRSEELPKKRGKHFTPALNQLSAAFGELAMTGITSETIARHRDARLKTVSPSTVKKEINLLSSLIDLAGKEWGIPIAANPCAMVARPVEPRGRDRRLEADEEERLIAACQKSESATELVAIVQLALATGARLGELLKLEWKNVNLSKRTAKLIDTKNGDDREIPLSGKAIQALESMPRHIGGRVFWRWRAADSFNKIWVRTCKRAGIEGLKFHDLRHEAVSRLFEHSGNFSTMEIASISGHKTLAMLKRYTHLRAEDLAKKLG